MEHICPNCKNSIYDDEALLCHFCGGSLRRDIGVFGRLKYRGPHAIVAVVALIVLIMFLVVMLR
jgi:predicted amidophosphoribosyltransferase